MDHSRHSWRSKRRLFGIIAVPQWLEFGVIGIAALGLFVVSGVIVWSVLVPIPAINSFENRQIAQSTKIYDRTGNIVLYDVHGSVRRTSVDLDQISPYVQKAVVATEDATFYTNAGFRPLSFLRAVFVNIFTGSYAQGGSTITQQVVKNALLTQNKTVTRKIEEIILALRLNKAYTKSQILNTYLNETPYGGTIYGIEEASQYFFGVSAKDVDLAQAAYLAAIPQAPTYFSPYGTHKDKLDSRKSFVLARMKENHFITDDEYKQALLEDVQFKQETEAGIKAPHFVFFIREYLENKYGVDAVNLNGLRVITTLDYDLQQKAEDTVSKFAPGMQKNFNASNEGMVAIEPKTGQILAMVGSRGYFDDTIDGKVNVTVSLRQPGSSFKPFVYATAFQKEYTPETVVFDVPTQFSTACAMSDIFNDTPPCYSPSNYDGKFRGPMTLRNAIAQSQNIPSVKTLYLAGIQDSIKMATDLGISTLADSGRYGLTLVLGGGEVKLLEMTGAYAVFANDGVKNPPTGILEIRDNRGTIMEQYENKSTRVIDPQIARQISDVLSDNVARTPEFGADSPLYFSKHDVADKTGTTNDFHDVWILGYTPGISVGAWAGNNDNKPMAKKIAAFIIAPMWHEFMAYAIDKYPGEDFTPPAPDPDLATLPPVLKGNWNTNPALGIHDILYWIQKNNPRAGMPTNAYADPQAQRWDYAVQAWTQQVYTGTTSAPGPTGSTGNLTITSPQSGTTVPSSSALSITASYVNPGNIVRITYYINNMPIGSASSPPYQVSITPSSLGPNILRAVAELTNGGTEEQSIAFTVQ